MTEEKALTEYKPEQFAIMEMEQEELDMILEENLGGDSLKVSDLTRVNVPAGGGKIWTFDTVDGEFEGKELTGIIIMTKIVRSYWETDFNESGGGSAPDCFSLNGKDGVGEVADSCGGKCKACPMNEFGSGKNGKGRACKESRLIFMLTKDDILPLVIKAPVMSLNNARQYLVQLMSRRKAIHSVYTTLTLANDKNEDGIKYSKVVFTKVGDVEDPNATRAYALQIRPHLDSMASKMTKEKDTPKNDYTSTDVDYSEEYTDESEVM